MSENPNEPVHRGVFITCAVTGGGYTTHKSDKVPITPEQIADVARDEDVDLVGLSILSGSHLQLVPDVVQRLAAEGVDVPVVVGGIIPDEDAVRLKSLGVAQVYTPKDFELNRILGDIVELAAPREIAA